MTATWMADALRAGGCAVDEGVVPDWKSRGHAGKFDPAFVVGHHTAGPRTGDLPSLRTVRDGRPGLEGPLSQLMLSRSGVWVPIAAGLAWHAGAGSWPGVPKNAMNSYGIGVEAESCGTVDDWTPAQREAYPKGVAALLRHMGRPASNFIGHKEWAPGRKSDPAFWDLDAFRATVAGYLGAPAPGPVGQPVQTPSPAPTGARPPVLKWPFPRGHYVGDRKGPAASHGGYYASERPFIRNVQQWLIYRGAVPGVAPSSWATSGWADGYFDDPFSTQAAARWSRANYPGQAYPEQVWADDYRVLTR